MRVVFTKNELIGSKIIRFFTKAGRHIESTPSHLAVIFEEELVVEAVILPGVRINYSPYFRSKNTILKEYKYLGMESERVLMARMLEQYYGQGYDFIGVFWFGYQIIKKWITGKPIPKTNYWQRKNKAFCNEILSVVTKRDMSHVDPHTIMLNLKNNPLFDEVRDAN